MIAVHFTTFWQIVFEVRLKFPKFAANLAFSLRNCQSNCELRNKVVNFTLNFVGKLRSLLWAKFALSGVVGLVYNYKWIFNQSEKILNQVRLICTLWCLLTQTDGATCVWFTVAMQIQKFNNTTLKCPVFLHYF